jgi:hypothetical protein
MAMTTSSSMRVKALRFMGRLLEEVYGQGQVEVPPEGPVILPGIDE